MFTYKKLIAIGLSSLLLIVIAIAAVIIKGQKEQKPLVHYHAGFIVFQDGKKLDFSDIKYMHLAPCVQGGKETADDPSMKAHLHDDIGDVVHVHRAGAVWQDLFTNIKFPIDYTKTTGYINGQKVTAFQKTAIVKNDSLVVFIGKVDESLLSQAVTVDHIESVSSHSETCGN